MDDLQVGGRCSIPQAFSAATTHNVPVLSLRYWSSQSDFVSKAQQVLGVRLPEPTLAREISPLAACAGSMLAWRGPTETVLIARKGEVGAVLDELSPSSGHHLNEWIRQAAAHLI